MLAFLFYGFSHGIFSWGEELLITVEIRSIICTTVQAPDVDNTDGRLSFEFYGHDFYLNNGAHLYFSRVSVEATEVGGQAVV